MYLHFRIMIIIVLGLSLQVCHHLQQNELEMSSSPHVSQVRTTPKSTPKATHNLFAGGFKRFRIRPPFWKKHPGQRLDDGSLPRPHTIFSSPTISDRFEPPFSSTPFSRTIALSSPKREEPVLVNIGVDPKPLIDTESGERFVCDISIDVQPGGSDLQAQLAHGSRLSSPYTQPEMGVFELRRRRQTLPWYRHYHGGPHVSGLSSTFGTSADTSRARTPVMGVSQLRRRGQIRHDTPTSTGGLFTPTIHRSPRRSGTPGSPYNPSTVNEENFLDQSAAGRTMGSEGGYLEGSLYDSSIVNEGRFLDWP